MPERVQVFVAGAALGGCAGVAAGIWQDMDLPALLFRAFLLALAGGWMALLLAWLDALLPRETEDENGLHRDA